MQCGIYNSTENLTHTPDGTVVVSYCTEDARFDHIAIKSHFFPFRNLTTPQYISIFGALNVYLKVYQVE